MILIGQIKLLSSAWMYIKLPRYYMSMELRNRSLVKVKVFWNLWEGLLWGLVAVHAAILILRVHLGVVHHLLVLHHWGVELALALHCLETLILEINFSFWKFFLQFQTLWFSWKYKKKVLKVNKKWKKIDSFEILKVSLPLDRPYCFGPLGSCCSCPGGGVVHHMEALMLLLLHLNFLSSVS